VFPNPLHNYLTIVAGTAVILLLGSLDSSWGDQKQGN
jgi:hypothetical protein